MTVHACALPHPRGTLLAFLVPTILFLGCSRSDERSSGDAVGPVVPRYATVRPLRMDLERSTAQPGRVHPFEETPIVARVPGYVRKVAVDIGRRVKSGDVLMELEAPELEDEIHQRKAELVKARADVTQAAAARDAAMSKVHTADAAVREAEAGIDRAQSEYLRASDELARVEALTKSSAVTPRLLDETRHSHRSADAGRKEAAAKVASARAQRAEAEAMAIKAKADLKGAEARVGVAQANLEQAVTMADYLVVRAPFDGVVAARNVHTGHYVGGDGHAAAPLLTLLKTDPVRIVIDVPESESAALRVGARIRVHVLALPKENIEGVVARTSESLNPNNRTLRVEVDAPNPEGRLLRGMYVHATIAVAARQGVLTLPASAILRSPDGAEHCFVVEAGKRARRPIGLGIQAGERVEITSGLEGTEDVVRTLSESLSEGSPAQAIPEPLAAK